MSLYKAGLSQPNSTYKVTSQAVIFSGGGTTPESPIGCYVSLGGLASIDLENQYCGTQSNPYSLSSNNEIFESEYVANSHHYIFNFYDASGNLIVTITVSETKDTLVKK